jgi:hemerythrin-like domain-containing protein
MTQGPSVAQAVQTTAGEHDKLRRLLAQVESAFGRSEPHASSGPDVVAARLDTLRGPLRAHFDEEERSGVFARICEAGGSRVPADTQLLAEHRDLIQRLDALRSASALERRGPMWLRDVRRFLEALAGHESRESELIDETGDES